MKVLLTAGGTAGHIYPALSVADRLANAHEDVAFVGTVDGLEARLVPESGITFRGLAARGFDRARPLSLLTAAALVLVSTARAWRWLGTMKPDVVIGFGAYVSLPVGLAAVLRRVPLVLHEQNSVPGLANRILSRWAAGVGVTYEESAAYLAREGRVALTGNPVREQVATAQRSTGRQRLGLPETALVLLVFGGSRGARHINTALAAIGERLLDVDGLNIVHVTGQDDYESALERVSQLPPDERGRWQVHGYLSEMGEAIAAADLVVSRAGATTLAELTALGVPAIVVPYPYATDDHQTKNAATLVDHAAAVLLRDDELDTSRFGDEVLALLADAPRRATMAAASAALGRRDAAERLIELARQAASGHSVTPLRT